MRRDSRGRRTESGGRADAASCSRIHAQLMSTADAKVNRTAKPIECKSYLLAPIVTQHGQIGSAPMSLVDASTEFGQRVERRLREEKIAWLTTVAPSGTPQPVPVWFLWDGSDSMLISTAGRIPRSCVPSTAPPGSAGTLRAAA